MNYFMRLAIIALIDINSWTKNIYSDEKAHYGRLGAECIFLHFEEFHSQSFVPNALLISYRIENGIGIYYNMSALQSFPGKILFNVFIRKVPTKSGEKSVNIIKHRNLDFCKTIELMRNFTKEEFQNASLLQSTFINSCPFTRGFYYVTNGTVDMGKIPLNFARGLYWVQVELVQVFGEVTKLMNARAKCRYEPVSSRAELSYS